MEVTSVTLSDLEGHSAVAGLLKFNLSNIRVCAAFYTISTDSGKLMLARFLCIGRASCLHTDTEGDVGIYNAEIYRIPTIEYRKYRESVPYLPPGCPHFTGILNSLVHSK